MADYANEPEKGTPKFAPRRGRFQNQMPLDHLPPASPQWTSGATYHHMSYFMTISGELPLQSFPPLEFLPVSKGQRYVANLEAEFAAADGSPVWFVHDGQTGTSHAFVSDARDYYGGSGNIDGTQLLLLIKACIDADCGFRIWWPTHKPGAPEELAEFTAIEELPAVLARLFGEGWDVCLRRKRIGKTTALKPDL